MRAPGRIPLALLLSHRLSLSWLVRRSAMGAGSSLPELEPLSALASSTPAEDAQWEAIFAIRLPSSGADDVASASHALCAEMVRNNADKGKFLKFVQRAERRPCMSKYCSKRGHKWVSEVFWWAPLNGDETPLLAMRPHGNPQVFGHQLSWCHHTPWLACWPSKHTRKAS